MNFTRRNFLKSAAFGSLFLLTVGGVKSVLTVLSKPKKRELFISLPLEEGVNLVEDVIVVSDKGCYSVFSRRCTHLGCKLKRESRDSLICPCHSSRFGVKGEVLRGPATADLETLAFKHDHSAGRLIVEIIS